MPRRSALYLAAGSVCLLAAMLVERMPASHASASRHSRFDAGSGNWPRAMVWAWERPEDLRSLDPQKVGVAFLARTIYVRPSPNGGREALDRDVVLRPRFQPLLVSPGTALMAVVRIETGEWLRPENLLASGGSSLAGERQRYSAEQRTRIAAMIADAARLPGVRAVQIDFDATVQERGFYRELLVEVRRLLPSTMPLSITALASWCMGDPWLDELPPGTIDEAVPMLFRMGPDAGNVAQFVLSGEQFRAPACRGSVGVSHDEPLSLALLKRLSQNPAARSGGPRIYLFGGRVWTQQGVELPLVKPSW